MRRRCIPVFLICLVIGMLGAVARAEDGVTLRYKFTPGEVLRYNINVYADISMQINMTGADQVPSVASTMMGVMRQTTKRVLSNGDAEIEVTYDSLKMAAGGAEIPIDMGRMPAVTMVMSPSGEVKSSRGISGMAAAFGGMPFTDMGSLVRGSAFPSKALKVGDNWTHMVPFPLGGKMKVQSRLINSDPKFAVVRQIISGNIAISSPLPRSEDVTADARGNGSFDIVLYFSPSEGRLVKAQGSGMMPLSLSALDTQGGMTADVRMTMQMSLIPKEAQP